MAEPEEILTPADFKNYRNVRAVAALFLGLAALLTCAGIVSLLIEAPVPEEEIPTYASIIMLIAGLAGTIGALAALTGNRRWAPLVYIIAAGYIFAFPLGTILSAVLLTGMKRYLNSMEQIKVANAKKMEPAAEE